MATSPRKSQSVADAAKSRFAPPTPEQSIARDRQLAKASADKKHAEAEKRILQREIDTLTRQLNAMRSSRFTLKPPSSGRGKRGSYCRICIPDTHGAKIDQDAAAAMFGDLQALAPAIREIVLLGDHLDCGGFLAQHHTMGYVAETSETFEEDVIACNLLLDRVAKACPKAETHYIEGNHERRIEKWCVTQALGSAANASYFQKLFGVEAQLSLSKRGIKHYAQGQFCGGARVPGTVRLGRCCFTHGNRTGANPAQAMLRDFGCNVVFGHVHRICVATDRSVKEGEIGAWSPGCLSKLQPLYMHTQITGWSHGYGLQFVEPDGSFLHVNVPIIEGRSYLVPLIELVK